MGNIIAHNILCGGTFRCFEPLTRVIAADIMSCRRFADSKDVTATTLPQGIVLRTLTTGHLVGRLPGGILRTLESVSAVGPCDRCRREGPYDEIGEGAVGPRFGICRPCRWLPATSASQFDVHVFRLLYAPADASMLPGL